MNGLPAGQSRALEWCFRFGVPAAAWTLVVAFFAFAGSVSTDRRDVGRCAAAGGPAPSCAVEPTVIDENEEAAAVTRPGLSISLPSATTHAEPPR